MGTPRRTTIAIALGLTLATGCGAGDKAGGEGGVKTLELGTPDPPGRIGSDHAERFAAEVRRRSQGRLRVRIVWEAPARESGGYTSGWDKVTADLVRDGRLDLGLIPARAWDTLGVSSLQALQAPFLITTDKLLAEVIDGPARPQMLAGLAKTGVVGLALLPEEMRHPVGFERALRGPDDYRGRLLRVPRSRASYRLMRALGARPVDLNGAGFEAAVRSGRVTGAESGLALVTSLPAPGTVTANVALFPKVNTLVADAEAFAALSEEQRSTLREAAAATLDDAVEGVPYAREAVSAACRRGAQVTTASAADLAALERAARPVYAALERDPLTRALIARIRALKAEAPVAAAPPPECGSRATRVGSDAPATRDPSVLNGVYRYTLEREELIDAGVEPAAASNNYGITTNTLRDGRFVSATRSPGGASECSGDYTVSDEEAEVKITSAGCSGHFRFRWAKTPDGLRVTDVRSLPPFDAPADRVIDRAIWGSKPWQRIADVAPARPAAFPDGVYRATVTEDALVRAGATGEELADEVGVQTLTIERGRFTTHATKSEGDPPDCFGRVVTSGRRVTFMLDAEPCGGPGGSLMFTAGWVLGDGGLRFTDVQSPNPTIVAVIGGRTWQKIG